MPAKKYCYRTRSKKCKRSNKRSGRKSCGRVNKETGHCRTYEYLKSKSRSRSRSRPRATSRSRPRTPCNEFQSRNRITKHCRLKPEFRSRPALKPYATRVLPTMEPAWDKYPSMCSGITRENCRENPNCILARDRCRNKAGVSAGLRYEFINSQSPQVPILGTPPLGNPYGTSRLGTPLSGSRRSSLLSDSGSGSGSGSGLFGSTASGSNRFEELD